MMELPATAYRSPCVGSRSAGSGAARRWPEPGCVAASAVLYLLTACASHPPPPDWQMNAKLAAERALTAYLSGDARIEAQELQRARSEIARTGRADLLARIELAHCAARVASLVFQPCAAFEALRADAPAPERAYADYLAARVQVQDIGLLPEAQRSVAAGVATAPGDAANGARNVAANVSAIVAANGTANVAANGAALGAIADPLSRLVAAGVLFEANRADPQVIGIAIDTASSQGWRRPLLAWLGLQLKRVELAGAGAGASDEAQRLRRRIEIVHGGGAGR